VAIEYTGGGPDLTVTTEAASGSHRLDHLDPPDSDGFVVRLEVEWGGAEPPGSLGRFIATRSGRQPLELELTAAVDEDGRLVTQHAFYCWRDASQPGGDRLHWLAPHPP
jgi:hypothetical protein